MVTARGRTVARRAFALVDVVIGGVILAIGLATVVSIAERSLAMQQRSEREATAAGLLDGLLNEVVAVGVVEWQLTKAAEGAFETPFDGWNWALAIRTKGVGDPFEVVATVRDPVGGEHSVATLVAPRPENSPDPVRIPEVPIDRQSRYDELP